MSPSPLRLYSYPRCSTCRKAIKWLDQHGVAMVLHDITLTPPSRSDLALAWGELSPPQRLFNSSGQSYRSLGAATARAMTMEQALDALSADGKLIRRPFLIRADPSLVLVGFDPERWSEALLTTPQAPSRHPVPPSAH
ncbi:MULTISPECIES: Spx/MgsR family RNA polymerase-binding regulatory protein [unclassified Synechococcus]|uniref:Spx/MgsR family RNA polymerase-binding regulatory protein n=1 Tax=unclassified Synechococcus TaxID=2626047 RepID=UPI0021A35EEA|nr:MULTISPECIES: Spx/MgsR family RNA polymerase-binding regulatory protein [unclassified Synechococcus]MCT0213013.1 Spx/MgsR family RNA polymerase-binding regulatory protein [Synechococcus sp. CS-1326]MCT0232258.1 Spx/MgsR family RNA polymerase-binding regulatory protein [Synechococcus sp. CS-1327]